MNSSLEALSLCLQKVLHGKPVKLTERLDELTLELKPADLLAAMVALRDHAELRFDQLIDLCGMDYLNYGDGAWEGSRFAVVYHLLSVRLNQRLRVRVFASDDDLPVVNSVVDVWPNANWYEREAFDLYGIVFEGHPDLRLIS